MKNNFLTILFLLVVAIYAVLIAIPKTPSFLGDRKMNLGLDLQGGVQLIYQIETEKLKDKDESEAQQEAIDLIRRRLDNESVFGGTGEQNIQMTRIGDKPGIIVELPGVHDIDNAKGIIGKTAQLKFYELDESGNEKETDLTGADIKRAAFNIDQTSSISASPIIDLEFTPEGAKKFKEITKRNIGKALVTKLDDEVINTATVQTEIDGGKAVITGLESKQEAKDTARLINEGALPAPIKLVQEGHVGASLGRDSIEKSLIAGIFGILLVAIFMVVYYKGLGLVATIALTLYTIIVVAIFKILNITMTISGIAGFIFSIGIAVDANILIFERFKEELKKNLPRKQALENSFSRSWPSIRDSNAASIITGLVLYYLAAGTVKGFAVTLIIGILASLFTSITVTRNILRFFVKERHANN
ncbi:MAG: preprotein translocase subunit SecD [candidate division WS2 bacterium ADurb.Bin280]|uniref:Protein translocase subunit SecD n=1 Tax=candidate division WS2 bacterium ADurb.Bin280 TaxID=1852829 RepID=A0A1V5SGV2_9BACT|nr:MAG: preprotein translocase subunit SecD [candidate division WS2 bacterium ADurb.Bin280]